MTELDIVDILSLEVTFEPPRGSRKGALQGSKKLVEAATMSVNPCNDVSTDASDVPCLAAVGCAKRGARSFGDPRSRGHGL